MKVCIQLCLHERVPGPSGSQGTVPKNLFYGHGGEGNENDVSNNSVDNTKYHAGISDKPSDLHVDNDDDDDAGMTYLVG